MAKSKTESKRIDMNEYWCKNNAASNSGGAVYFFGFIGAAIYYVQNATGFWNGALGILKALVWPAFLVYKLLGM